jgi:hypothetical protein
MKSPLKIIQAFFQYETGTILFTQDLSSLGMNDKAFWTLSYLNSFYGKLKYQLLSIPKDTMLLTTYKDRIERTL